MWQGFNYPPEAGFPYNDRAFPCYLLIDKKHGRSALPFSTVKNTSDNQFIFKEWREAEQRGYRKSNKG
jgi:hypothetical protein